MAWETSCSFRASTARQSLHITKRSNSTPDRRSRTCGWASARSTRAIWTRPWPHTGAGRSCAPTVVSGLPEMIRSVEQQIALAARLGGVLRGEDKPSGAGETLAFAGLCFGRSLHVAAARFFADAFAADPNLVVDRVGHRRYDAACSAALAGCGKGKDNPQPDEAARTRLPPAGPRLAQGRAGSLEPTRHRPWPGVRKTSSSTWGNTARMATWRACATPKRWPSCPKKSRRRGGVLTDVDSALKAVPEKPK